MKRITCFVAAACFSSTAIAVDVRGRIDFFAAYGVFPMARATVEICQNGIGCQRYVTGEDGMYYFNARPGPHDVLVNGRIVFKVGIPNAPYFDILPLRGN